MQTVRIVKLDWFKFSSFAGYIGFLIGILLGALYSFGGLIIDGLVSLKLVSAVDLGTPGLSYGTLWAFGALIGMPMIFAVVGFIVGSVGAVLFNLTAPRIDGIPLKFKPLK